MLEPSRCESKRRDRGSQSYLGKAPAPNLQPRSEGARNLLDPLTQHEENQKAMSTPEVKVKKAIRKMLDESGAYYAMPIGTGYGNSGVPDFLICSGGRFIAVEAKAGDNKPTALQERELQHIRDAGGTVFVINETNEKDVSNWIAAISGAPAVK